MTRSTNRRTMSLTRKFWSKNRNLQLQVYIQSVLYTITCFLRRNSIVQYNRLSQSYRTSFHIKQVTANNCIKKQFQTDSHQSAKDSSQNNRHLKCSIATQHVCCWSTYKLVVRILSLPTGKNHVNYQSQSTISNIAGGSCQQRWWSVRLVFRQLKTAVHAPV